MTRCAQMRTVRGLIVATLIAGATLVGTGPFIAANDAPTDGPPLEWEIKEQQATFLLDPDAFQRSPALQPTMADRVAGDLLRHHIIDPREIR